MSSCEGSTTSRKEHQTNEYVCYKAANQCMFTVMATNQSALYNAVLEWVLKSHNFNSSHVTR